MLHPFFRFSRFAWIALIFGALAFASTVSAGPYADRFVWVFGWGLGKDGDVDQIDKVLETAAQHGMNGAVLSGGLDAMSRQSPDYFRRLDHVRQTCERLHLELIPSVFSVGYGSPALGEDKMLAEGLPVKDAPLVVSGGEARLTPDQTIKIPNGDFENFTANHFPGPNFIDQPGEISFADTNVKHSGKASLRLENFSRNQYGHGRAMYALNVQPYRCYRVILWVKTEGLEPAGVFRMTALANNRDIAPREYRIPATSDWQKLTMLFNSLDQQKVNLYAGVWGAKQGKVWLDDWAIEEVGPINVLHRAGTPVTVRSDDGATTFVEGEDYAPLVDKEFNFYHNLDRPSPALRLLPHSAIKVGQRLKVSWYHPMLINDSQVTVCMAEPKLYEIFDRSAKLLAEHLHPKRVLLNMDEIRMGGTCDACRGHDMAALLGECITREVQILRKYIPGVQVYIWSDMLDPNHNAHDNYYLVRGSLAGSWTHVPKDLVIAVWGGTPRAKSLQFFHDQGFQTLVSCYYDADDLTDVKGWLKIAEPMSNVRGFMYTPWTKKYGLLGEFGDLLKPPERK